jgi:hypothetical protein
MRISKKMRRGRETRMGKKSNAHRVFRAGGGGRIQGSLSVGDRIIQ